MTIAKKARNYSLPLFIGPKIKSTCSYSKHSKHNYTKRFYRRGNMSTITNKKDRKVQYLLAASIILTRSPMYNPANAFILKPPTTYRIHNYINLTPFQHISPTSSTPHDNTNVQHWCFPFVDDYSEYITCPVIDDEIDDIMPSLLGIQITMSNHSTQTQTQSQ